MSDCIRLVGMSFYAFHGAIAAEQETGRMYEVDAELEVDLTKSSQTDSLPDTVDYSAVFTTIRNVVEQTQFKLVEALAGRIASVLLDKFPLQRVTLHVRKLTPPIAGHIRHIEVQMTRYRGNTTAMLDTTER